MKKSQLDAKPYGMGELITQRKVLAVPEHQRSYSWPKEDVEQFLDDINTSFTQKDGDYFIGVVVLQVGLNNEWLILDGQQRLTTSTIIYAAMRDWLSSRGLKEDALQLENEFIGARKLGGNYSSRLSLNFENREFFDKYVLCGAPDDELSTVIKSLPKNSTNRFLLEAIMTCRKWINEHVSQFSSREEQARVIFNLALYIERNVKVVCVDVSSESDAYVIFEALNDRGVDLSALDLVKNHIYSHADAEKLNEIRDNWANLKENIEGKDADDFLKVFWTARFGVVQKVDLFEKIRNAYPDSKAVHSLVKELYEASEIIKAIEDQQHELWTNIGETARLRMFKLNILGSKLVRSVILSAIYCSNKIDIDELLSSLIVLIVRYQLIGRERTGVLEKTLGKLSESIWNGSINSHDDCKKLINTIMPNNDDFRTKLSQHVEKKPSRVAYILLEAECFNRFDGTNQHECLNFFGDNFSRTSVDYILPKIDSDESDLFFRIGNRALLEYELLREARKIQAEHKIDKIYSRSIFESTKDLTKATKPLDNNFIISRSEYLSNFANMVWGLDSNYRA